MRRTERIAELLRAAFPGLGIEIVDESASHAGHGGFDPEGSHFRVRIADALTHAGATLAKHRLVYDALRPLLASGEIHALSIELVATPATQA